MNQAKADFRVSEFSNDFGISFNQNFSEKPFVHVDSEIRFCSKNGEQPISTRLAIGQVFDFGSVCGRVKKVELFESSGRLHFLDFGIIDREELADWPEAKRAQIIKVFAA